MHATQSFYNENFAVSLGSMGNSKISRDKKNECLSFIKSNFDKLSQRKMAKMLGLGNTTVNRWSSEIGLKFRKHTVNEEFFDEFNEESVYLLGLIYADGNIAWGPNPKKGYYSMTITASEKDKTHLEKMRNLLSSTKPLLYAPKTKSYRLIVNSKKLCRRLMQLGVTPRKSLTIQFPQFIPKEHLPHFLRGVIDGDGSVNYFARKISPYFRIVVASGSKDFCEGLVDAIRQNVGPVAKIKKKALNTYIVEYSCYRGEKLADYIYSDASIFLKRKYSQFEKLLEVRKND